MGPCPLLHEAKLGGEEGWGGFWNDGCEARKKETPGKRFRPFENRRGLKKQEKRVAGLSMTPLEHVGNGTHWFWFGQHPDRVTWNGVSIQLGRMQASGPSRHGALVDFEPKDSGTEEHELKLVS